MNNIVVKLFQFDLSSIPKETMELIREHNGKILSIDGYADSNIYDGEYVSSIDLEIEGDIGDLNKLAIALNATTDRYGYTIK